MGIILGKQQEEAFKIGYKWFKKGTKQVLEISGLAGTGKSTIITMLIDELGLQFNEVVFVAYTGKATQVLNRKGMNAKTIHSMFYELLRVPVLDENDNPVMVNGRLLTEMVFRKRDKIDENVKLIVVDECGMVGETVGEDILSFGLPVIVLGDLHQLPPVLDNPFFLKEPDIQLTEIMRQAEDNPLIHISQSIIKGRPIEFGSYGDKVLVIGENEIKPEMYTWGDIILCSKNATRDNINNYVKRELLNRNTNELCRGDKIICRKNNWETFTKYKNDDIYLINGLIGEVTSIHRETFTKNKVEIDFRPDFFEKRGFNNLPLDLFYFKLPHYARKKYKENKLDRSTNLFELAYAITVYSSQGSEWDKGFYMGERMGDLEFQKKVDYTAVTRFRDRMIWAMPKKKIYYNISNPENIYYNR